MFDTVKSGARRAMGTTHRRRERIRVIVLLAAVLALGQADNGSVGALGPTLEREFHITHFGLALLAAAFAVVGALATFPVGVLTDRVRRVSLLTIGVVLWSVAMVLGGFAVSFAMLLITRMFLGTVTATGGPTIASLTGDFFGRSERARVLSVIQTGEYVGIGLGLLATGAVLAVLSWRWLYWLFALLGIGLALLLRRLPEPERGGSEALDGSESAGPSEDPIAAQVVAQKIEPDPDAIIDTDPDEMSLAQAIHEVLRVKTNVIVIIATTMGYFFFAGLRLFAVLFATAQYSISNSTAALLLPLIGVGAVAGLLLGGRTADWLTRRGVLSGRIVVAMSGYVIATIAFLPTLFIRDLALALPLLAVGAAGLAAANPPLDAVRLDVVPPKLWGRAESVRTLTRTAAEALGPIVCGVLADHLGGGGHRGVQLTLLILIPALLANGLLLLFAARTYPHDVASELVSSGRAAAASS